MILIRHRKIASVRRGWWRPTSPKFTALLVENYTIRTKFTRYYTIIYSRKRYNSPIFLVKSSKIDQYSTCAAPPTDLGVVTVSTDSATDFLSATRAEVRFFSTLTTRRVPSHTRLSPRQKNLHVFVENYA